MGKAYYGVSGVARKVSKAYIGVNGVARQIKKAYIGVNGVARLAYEYGGSFPDYLCFTANEDNCSISMAISEQWTSSYRETYPLPRFKYTKDKGLWQSFTPGETTITLENAGDKVYIRAEDRNASTGYYWYQSSDYELYTSFVIVGSISASGNIMSLLDKTCQSLSFSSANHAAGFYKLFYGCNELTSSPSLPATSLCEYCYCQMFSGCDALSSIPSIPALYIPGKACYWMFFSCDNVKIYTTQTSGMVEYRIPTTGTGSVSGSTSLNGMFSYTGGDFKSTPTINTTYYTTNTVV